MNNEEKTKSKFNVIFKLINKFKEVWLTSNDYEKSFIETTLGAAIFYLPTTKKTFSGLISEEASKISKKKWVKISAIALGLPSGILGLSYLLYQLMVNKIISKGVMLMLIILFVFNAFYLMFRLSNKK